MRTNGEVLCGHFQSIQNFASMGYCGGKLYEGTLKYTKRPLHNYGGENLYDFTDCDVSITFSLVV